MPVFLPALFVYANALAVVKETGKWICYLEMSERFILSI